MGALFASPLPRAPVVRELRQVVPIDAVLPTVALELIGPMSVADARDNAVDHALRNGEME
jgi:hypothetical protein